jgi:hypothetical protein
MTTEFFILIEDSTKRHPEDRPLHIKHTPRSGASILSTEPNDGPRIGTWYTDAGGNECIVPDNFTLAAENHLWRDILLARCLNA